MSVLSDRDILEHLEKQIMHIENFNEKNLTPNGYDLTIGSVKIPSEEIHLKEGIADIPPMTRFLVGTKEYIKMSDKISAQLWIRSSWARKGILASFGKIDAGFEGILTLAAFNSSNDTIQIDINNTFAQIVFLEMKSKALKTYEKRSGNYQKQKEIKI